METRLVWNTVVVVGFASFSACAIQLEYPRLHVHHRGRAASVHSKSSFEHLESINVKED